MKKNLRYGTATTLLVTMVASPIYATTAYAGGRDFSEDDFPNAAMETGYGSFVIDHDLNDMYRLELTVNDVVNIVSVIAEGAALTAAGVELIRQMSKSTNSRHTPEK